jgi:HSP20 family protein
MSRRAGSRELYRPELSAVVVAPPLLDPPAGIRIWLNSHSEGGAAMRALTPWTGMASLKQEMDRLFERFGMGRLDWPPRLEEFFAGGEWTPSLDVADTKDALVVKAEIPGIDPKEIELSIQEQVLTIKGEKKQEKEEKEANYYRMERSYGAFARSVRLPAPVDAGKVDATFKNGVLTITLPKSQTAKGTPIPIKAE